MGKLRSEIEEQYKWDLSKLYSNINEMNSDINLIIEYSKKLLAFKGKIMESGKNLYDFYLLCSLYARKSNNLWLYCCLKNYQDSKDPANQALKMKIEKLEDSLDSQLCFIKPEILGVDYETFLEMVNEYPKLEEFKFAIDGLFRYKDHTLSKNEEELIMKANMAMGTGNDIFNNLMDNDIKCEPVVNESGEKEELNDNNYRGFLKSTNRNIRKQAFEKYYKSYFDLRNTIAAAYRGQIKEDFFHSNIRKYNSCLEESLYKDNIDKSVYTNLIQTVHNNMDKMYDYIDLRKRLLNIDELHMYDIYINLCNSKIKNIPFETGKNLVFEALKPLGEEYLRSLEKVFDERWIDIYPNNGKKGGAFCWATYDSNPYVLLNYNDNIGSVSTMAHELGHSMHNYYSKKQPFFYSGHSAFLGEIASTVNEMLLNDYLYKNARTTEDKKLYLNNFLEEIKNTLYRQTMFAEFEMLIHDKYGRGVSLTETELSNTYYQLNKLYFGDNMVVDDYIRYEWMSVPHFYRPFYVYKYATGISAATALTCDIINNVKGSQERYIEFLSSGCSNHPLDILKNAGVDMSTPEPIQKCLDMFGEKIKEYRKLI